MSGTRIRRAGVAAHVLSAALGLASPILAQTASRVPGPAPTDTAIVVTAPAQPAPGEQLSAWKRAEADNVVVYSDGGEDQLRRIAVNLENIHALIARLYRGRGNGIEPARLAVVLFKSADDMRELGLRNPRFEDGPYARPFAAQRYYDPRADGSVLALARTDQVIELNTSKARAADCDDYAEAGADCIGVLPPPDHLPALRPWEAVLYGAYAQHLVLNYAPAIYPRWYVDGIGALFSTIVFKRDGSLEYGRPPADYRPVFRSYGAVDTAGVLTGDYLRNPSLRMEWTPYHAWLLTHFFVFADPRGREHAQFTNYMAAIGRGQSMAEAAQAFGTSARLRNAIRAYAERPHAFAATAKSLPEPPPPIAALSQAAAEAFLASLAPRSSP